MPKLEAPLGNCLIAEWQEPPRCEFDQSKMIVIGPNAVCQQCGNRVLLDELKPKKRLAVKGDGTDIIAQPKDNPKLDEDIPPYATLISEEML